MKVCTQCKIEKDPIEFPKRKINKDGLYSWCKECSKRRTKEYSQNNPDAVKASRLKRREVALEKARIYKKLNKEKLEKKRKIYYQANREMLIEKAKWYGKNKTPEQQQKRKEYYLKWKTTESAKEYRKKYAPIRKERYSKHLKASQKVQDALRWGRLIKPENCSICNATGQIEGHHHDYDKPLDVIWVCKSCHRAIHKQLKEVENASKRNS